MGLKALTFVSRFAGYKVAGLESQIFDEYVQLGKRLEKLIVVASEVEVNSKEKLMEGNVEVYRAFTIPFPKLYGLTKIISFTLAPLIRRKEVDIVYVRTFSPPELISLWVTKHLAGLPTVLLIGGSWLFEPLTPRNRVCRWVLRRAVDAADRVILYSWRMLPDLKRYAPRLNEGKVRIVRNAVDIARFKPGLPHEDLKRLWAIREDEKVVLYVGRVNMKKGVEDIIKAAPLVVRSVKARFIIVGEGERSFIHYLKALAKELDVEENVIFTGPIPNIDIPRYYCLADVFVFMSRGGEGIPRVCLEAMACGNPVIATPVAGTADAVREGETGFIVPVMNYKALAEKAVSLLKDDNLRKSLGENGRKLIERAFSYDVVIPQIVNVFKQIRNMAEEKALLDKKLKP